jgi:hypothetical protein
MNTIDRFQSNPVNPYQEQKAVQLHRQQEKSDQVKNDRDKQIANNIQVHDEGQKIDLKF